MIALAFERNKIILIYNISGQQISQIALRSGAHLLSFTNANVNIIDGNYIYIYNEYGTQTAMIKI